MVPPKCCHIPPLTFSQSAGSAMPRHDRQMDETGERPMQALSQSYRGLGLLVRLNWDRALTGFVILGALAAGTWLATL